MISKLTREALLAAARRHLRPGITPQVALVLGYAEVGGQPLDPENFDDAAVILRAERLVLDDVPVELALSTALKEIGRSR
jgi:hypothetical protein